MNILENLDYKVTSAEQNLLIISLSKDEHKYLITSFSYIKFHREVFFTQIIVLKMAKW